MEIHLPDSVMRHFRVTERINEKLQSLSQIYSVLAPEHREKAIAGWHILFPDTDHPAVDVSKPRSTEDSENLDGHYDENENGERE